MATRISCPTPEQRRPCHAHEPDPTFTPTDEQQEALRQVRTGGVHALISACGPDHAVGASVNYLYSFTLGVGLPLWDSYKVLYQAGVVILVQEDPRYPYAYEVRLHPNHPLNN
jgi:hypothetical protein